MKQSIFTEDELEFINKLQDKGYITIATRDSNTVYKQMSDGNIEGFHYNLVKMFSEHINVDLKVKVISFNDYFRHNGEIPEGVKLIVLSFISLICLTRWIYIVTT